MQNIVYKEFDSGINTKSTDYLLYKTEVDGLRVYKISRPGQSLIYRMVPTVFTEVTGILDRTPGARLKNHYKRV